MAADKARSRRFGEPAKFLPVVFVIGVIATLYGIYTYTHLFRLLQVHTPESQRNTEIFDEGVWQTIVFNVLLFMMLVCLVLAVVTPPGSIPDRPEWTYDGLSSKDQPLEVQTALETKRSGDRRFCKWRCGKYKPDRAHHCRVCDTCVLRMDHHCPWIYNCVGFRNHKYFFLLLFYSSAASIFMSVTMIWTVNTVLNADDPSLSELFLVLFGETLACFMGLIVTGFFAFHIFLAVKGLTTIEFCEKQKSSSFESVFSRGVYGNFQDILGRNPLVWLLPFPLTSGDGLSYEVDLNRFGHNEINEKTAEEGSRSPVVFRDDDGGTGGANPQNEEKAPLIQ